MTRIMQTLVVRLFPRLMLAVLVAGALIVPARATHAAATPEQKCQKGRYSAAAKYSACEQKATGKFMAGGSGHTKFNEAVSKCRVKYTGTWAKLQAKASGSGSTCDNGRYGDNGDGTVIDRLTGLQWEQKTDDASVHDKDNVYTWTAGFAGMAADGTAFTSFLAALNGGGCFAGQCDWRLPTRAEILVILSEPYPCTTSPCIDQGVFGPTGANLYWSATTHATGAGTAWYVYFGTGDVGDFSFSKASAHYVRVVRGGL